MDERETRLTLEPCPFCGATDKETGEADIVLVVRRPAGPGIGFKAVCTCGAETALCVSRPLAIRQWNTRTLRSVEPPPDAINLLRLILPLAKGYAHEHPVGSNQQYVSDAEEFLATQWEAK